MDLLTVEALRELVRGCGGEHVSLFMPTHGAAPDNRKDPLQFRALLRQAEGALIARGKRLAEAGRLLSPAHELAEDGIIWRPHPGGLAAFVCDDGMRVYRSPVRLEPAVRVGDRFSIRPALAAADRGERFFVLALSQNSVRLFRGTRDGLTELDLGDLPQDILDALRIDGFEQQLQSHSSSSGPAPGKGRGAVVFHGSGADTGVTTRYLTEFVKRIAAGLFDLVHDREAPFVVAAVAELAAMYREADRTHNVTEAFVAGNPEATSQTDLHAAAWNAARRAFEAELAAIEERFGESLGTSHASSDPAEIVAAAAFGRVETLLVSSGATLRGRFDEDSGRVEILDDPEQGGEDLVELAIAHTIARSGDVHLSERGPHGLGALLRY